MKLATAGYLALLAAAQALYGQGVEVRLGPGTLRVTASNFHFLDGRPLEQLRNGNSVVFAVQLSLLGERKTAVIDRTGGRFAMSFDLWEEKFAVTRLGGVRKATSHLAAAAAEAWCLENLSVSRVRLSPSSPFWVRLEVRAEEPGADAPPEENAGINLARMVEFFSRSPHPGEPRWLAEGGPFRLAELK
jgi:hypothetical protein